MRNRLVLGFLSIPVISLSGCFVPARLIPISGPAAAEGCCDHRAVIKPKGAFNSGSFYVDLQEDRVFSSDECRGRWKAAAPPTPLVANDMASVWDTAYGEGYYTSHILGAKNCARGSGICKKRGTVLDAEVCQIENGQNRKTATVGVARDNKNSIYKIEAL
jgi:hypothetical protein